MVIELSGVQFWSEIIHEISKSNECPARVPFEIKQVWFQTKIAKHEVQLPLYYTHFEISQFFVNINIYLSTSGNPVSFSFWWAKNRCDLEQKIGDLGINRTVESQSDYKNHQWFQDGCNKGNNILTSLF